MSLSEIKNKYISKSKKAGSLFLLQPNDVLSYIDDCLSEGLTLEGVEGFNITPQNAYQPCQEHSNDFCDHVCTRDEFVDITKKFILDRIELDVWFEIIFT
jgi:hypothetical protein